MPSDCQKILQGGSEGRGPPSCIPNPATCAVDSEALRSKVSLRVSPAALKAQGKTRSVGKDRRRRAFSTSCGGPVSGPPPLFSFQKGIRRLADAGFFIEAQAAVAGQQGALLLSKKERMDGAV